MTNGGCVKESSLPAGDYTIQLPPVVPPHYCPGRAVRCPDCGQLVYDRFPSWPQYPATPVWYTGTATINC